MDGFGPQKRYAEDCASHDWILNLDADEVVTTELAREIAALMRRGEPLLPAFRFRQVTVYPGAESRGYGRISTTMSASTIAGACVSRTAVCMIRSTPGAITSVSSMASRCTSRGARSSMCAPSSSATPTCRPRSSRSRAPYLAAAAVRVSVPVLPVFRVETKFHGRAYSAFTIAHEISKARFRRLIKILRARSASLSVAICVQNSVCASHLECERWRLLVLIDVRDTQRHA